MEGINNAEPYQEMLDEGNDQQQQQQQQQTRGDAAGFGPQHRNATIGTNDDDDNTNALPGSRTAESYEDVAPATSTMSSLGQSIAHTRTSSYNSNASQIGPLMYAAGYRPGQNHFMDSSPYGETAAGAAAEGYVAPVNFDVTTGDYVAPVNFDGPRSPLPTPLPRPGVGSGDRSSYPSIERVNSDDTHNTYASWAYERALSAQMQLDQMKRSAKGHNRRVKRRSHFLPWKKNQQAAASSKNFDGADGSDGGKLDTWYGVFLPCLSQILGIIFYLRLPTITAQAGCIGATAIIAICVLSTFVTSLSLSAIATNGTIQAGGPYYIISRTLGVEIGGSLGLLFYLGNTIGAAMYVLGAVEAFQTDLDLYGAPAEEAAEEELDDLVAFYEIADDDDEEEEYVDPNAVIEEDEEEDWFGNAEIASMVLMFILAGMIGIGGMRYINYTTGTFLSINTLSIFSILFGAALFGLQVWDGSLTSNERAFGKNLWPKFSPDPKTGITPTWASLLALFYPSVTGIMAGTNRSGKLAKPSKSIPKGTISAITVTSLLYFIQVWLVGNVLTRKALMENKLILACLAWPSRFVIKAGIITASIGAALQCLAGAPQLLAAIAVDDAIPYLRFVKPYDFHDDIVTQKNANPSAAIFVTYIIASAASLVGNLDHITPLLTNCFLLMYGGINLCAFLLGWINAPGFRPSFRFYNKHVSLLGAILCLLLAFSISWFMAVLAIGLFFINYIYIRKVRQINELSAGYKSMGGSNDTKNLGDIGDSLRYKITMMVLMNVTSTENFHAKNWRPQLLTIVDTDDAGVPQNMELIALAAQLKKGRGLNVILSVKRGSIVKPGAYEAMMGCRGVMKRYMAKEGLEGYALISVTHQEFSDAVLSSVMSTGIGPVSPNLIMLPFLRDYKKRVNRAEELVKTIKGLTILKRAVVLFKGSSTYPRKGKSLDEGQIDIYWVVEEGGLCLLLPYLLSQHRIWRKNTTLRIFAVATDPNEDLDQLEASVLDYCDSVRIKATITVIDMARSTIATDMTRSNSPSGKGEKRHPYQSLDPYEHRMTISQALNHAQDFGGSKGVVGDTPRASSTRKMFSFEEEDKTRNGPSKKARSPRALDSGDLDTSTSFAEALQRPSMSYAVDDEDAADGPQMQTAKLFNNIIRFYSHSSNLVVTNMPLVESMSDTQFFFSYIERLSMCVDNIMLVKGSEHEVVTTVG